VTSWLVICAAQMLFFLLTSQEQTKRNKIAALTAMLLGLAKIDFSQTRLNQFEKLLSV